MIFNKNESLILCGLFKCVSCFFGEDEVPGWWTGIIYMTCKHQVFSPSIILNTVHAAA